tara:strand:- start:3986 stop:5725 length:1740 start_codon:yes stop_codon:yes gene_type:complete
MGIFDSFNQRVTGLGLPGGLGLLQAGTDMLGGKQIGDAVRGGLQTFQDVTQLDEERKRKALVQDLVSKGGFTPQEQALILASQNPAAVAAQIRAQKAAAALAASKPLTNLGQLRSDLERGLISPENYDKAVAKLTFTTPVKPTALQEKSDLLTKAGILPGSDDYNQALFGIPKDKETTLEERDRLLRAAGITPDSPEYLQSMFNITPDKVSAFAEKEAAVRAAGFEVGSKEYNQALFNIKDDKPSVFQEKITQLTNDKVEVGSAAWNQALYGITPKAPIFREFDGDLYKVNAEGGLDLVQKGTKDSKFVTVNGKVFRQDGENLVEVLDESKPKSANLINLLATRDFTLDGQLIKQGQVFALDKNSQTNLINQATNLQTGGAIIAPSAIENITRSQNNILENVEKIISETESKVSGKEFTIGTAAGGDIKGGLVDLGNAFLGFTFGVPLSEERSRQAAFIANANNQIKIPMVRALAPRGAKYARDEIDKIIPQSTDSNPKFVSKLRQILPDVEITIREVAKEIDAEESEKGLGTALGLRGQLENLISYKVSAEKALQNYDASNIKTETQKKADEILGIGN